MSIMRQNRWWIILIVLLFGLSARIDAQNAKADVKKHEQKVKDMVAFLEYVLNTLGSSSTSARDKDVLITESYTKIFRDAKVQIEDDLVEKRNVITKGLNVDTRERVSRQTLLIRRRRKKSMKPENKQHSRLRHARNARTAETHAVRAYRGPMKYRRALHRRSGGRGHGFARA